MGMSAKSLPSVFATLGTRTPSAESDADLLARFTSNRDDSAFAELVRRYARLVWRVARTRCRTDATAEDVFQAAFVVLSRKAGSIRTGGALAGWLHRTAHRLAVRGTKKERPAVPLPAQLPTSADPLDALSARELLAAVDDEMAKLSDAERSVLVLCGIDGLANDDAAKRLGCTTGAVKGRLERARAKLRTRLDARGLTLPAVLIGLVGSSPSASAIQAALAIPRGGLISPGVEQLIAEGLSMKATFTKATAVALLGVLTTFGVWSGVRPAPQVNAAPVPKAEPREGVILVSKLCTDPPNEILEALDTAGKSLGYMPVGNLYNVHRARVSPDGTRLAFTVLNGKETRGRFYDPEDVYVVDLPLTEPPKEPAFRDLLDPSVAWAPDGKTLFVSRVPNDTDVSLRAVTGQRLPRRTTRYDVVTKKEAQITLPDGHAVQDVSPHGKTLLTQLKVWNKEGFGYSSFLVSLDTIKAKPLGNEDDGFAVARFSPTGHRIVGTRVEGSKSKELGLFLADPASGKTEAVAVSKDTATGLSEVAWAPDGKRLAVLWREPAQAAGGAGGAGGPPGLGADAFRITVMDATGENAKTIREFKPDEAIRGVEWAAPKPAPDPRKKNAPVPKALRKDMTAWGEERGGLQAGLRMPDGTTVEPGQSAEVQVVVRNVGQKAVTVEFTQQGGGVFALGESKAGIVELNWMVSINGRLFEPRVETLEPGMELVRWKVLIRHTPTDDKLDPAVSKVDLPAGKYQFVMKEIGGDLLSAPRPGERPDFARLGTGSMEVTLPDENRVNARAPVPKAEAREGVILLSSFSEHHTLEVLKPDGEGVPVAKPTGAFNPWLAKLSVDGKRAAIPELAPNSGPGLNGWAKFRIRLLDLEAKEFDLKVIADEAYLPTVAWAADGNRMYGSHVDPEKLNGWPKQGDLLPFQTWVYDPATEKKTPVKLPSEHAVVGVSSDGKTLLTRTTEFRNPKQVLYLTPLATLKPEKFDDSPVVGMDAPRLSPDGKQLLWTRWANGKIDPATAGVFVTDVATKKETRVALPKEIETKVHHVCWSPNGKRIALYWYESVPRPKNIPVPAGPGPVPAMVDVGRLTVCDADGANPKVIHRRNADAGTITGLDWR